MPKPEQQSDREVLDEQTFEDWTKELTQQANEHYLRYCEASVIAATVLLGFIFNSIHSLRSGGTVVKGALCWLTTLGWGSALVSLGCGLSYILCSANTLFQYAKKSDGIRQSLSEGNIERAQQEYDGLGFPAGGLETRDYARGPFRRNHGCLVVQTLALFAAILLLSLALVFR